MKKLHNNNTQLSISLKVEKEIVDTELPQIH